MLKQNKQYYSFTDTLLEQLDYLSPNIRALTDSIRTEILVGIEEAAEADYIADDQCKTSKELWERVEERENTVVYSVLVKKVGIVARMAHSKKFQKELWERYQGEIKFHELSDRAYEEEKRREQENCTDEDLLPTYLALYNKFKGQDPNKL